ncbi:putative hex2 protein [Rosellinia necatrix]|uniref:Putative hex2 protein n=1 Tax=Rosellinia necatrix TaxID=77044 RepID=A0A1S7UJM2_ROSNE|nr:putative hex2 protein [Rosellinia necatrix]
MAVVLTSEESDLFSSSALRRSHSQSKFLTGRRPQTFHTSASTSRIDQLFHDNYRHQSIHIVPDSSPSSGPPSPTTLHVENESNSSYPSTPATSVSLDGQCDSDLSIGSQDPLLLSEYGDNPYFMLDDLEELEPPLSPQLNDSYTVSPADDSSASTSRPGSPAAPEHAEDDTAVEHHPTQHVDYLSHNWREEDIWSSWRYIISKRGEFANAPRLENASWRTWMKAKYGLKTVSPETLNWLKDCDVTWLYGPLQTRQCTMFPDGAEQGASMSSGSDSFIHKKPILKKRSMSEIMLQRSLSSSSLLKQAAAAVQAQQKGGANRIGRPILRHAHTDLVTFPFSKRRRSRANTSRLPSTATSGGASPAAERRHIHFDEQVKQCIAVEVKCDDDEDELDPPHWVHDDSDSDDGAIMMKVTKTGKKPIYLRKKPNSNNTNESKTIAMLPSTTLKYREDSPALPDSAIKHSAGSVRSPLISPSPSQETLRPSRSSGAFFQQDNEGDEPFQGNGLSANSSPTDEPPLQAGLHRSAAIVNLKEEEPAGMRRTESARDIAHVIWNVGWRR